MDYRHIKMGMNLLRHSRFDRNLVRYLRNLYAWRRLDKMQTTIEPFPTGLMLELGNKCNLHCIICPREYQYGKAMDIGFMPLDKAKAIIDELYPYLTSIGLTGLGETLLYPHLLEILQYIKAKKPAIQTTISTNANFLGFVEKITPLLPYLDSVQFSVDGVGKTYEMIRPNTDFSIIEQNIRKVVEMKPKSELMINTVITKENYKELPAVLDFAAQVGITNVNFNRMNLASIPEKREEYTAFFTGEEYNKQVVEKLSACKERFKNLTFSGYRVDGKPSFQDCGFVWHHHYITWDGYLVPCCAKPFPKELQFGNVFDSGVMAVINSEKAQRFRACWQRNQTPEFCKYCNNTSI